MKQKGASKINAILVLLIISLLIGSGAVAGGTEKKPAPKQQAGSSKSTQNPTPQPSYPLPEWPKQVIFGAGTGSSFYAIFTGLTHMCEKYLKVRGFPIGTVGPEALYLMKRGENHFAGVGVLTDEKALRGTHEFQKVGSIPLRAFIGPFTLDWNLLTMKGKGIQSFADLKNKVVIGWMRGASIGKIMFEGCLGAYDLQLKDLKKVSQYDKSSEAINALKTGSVDAIFLGASWPSAPIVELSTTHPMILVGLDDTHIKKMQEAGHPWMYPVEIPAGTYNNDKPIKIAAYGIRIFCHKDLPNSLVYAMTKMVFGHFDEWSSFHPSCKKFNMKDVLRYGVVPYHAGSIQYYKEAGFWRPEQDKRQVKLLKLMGETR